MRLLVILLIGSRVVIENMSEEGNKILKEVRVGHSLKIVAQHLIILVRIVKYVRGVFHLRVSVWLENCTISPNLRYQTLTHR